MKKVEAIIKPFMLEDIAAQLGRRHLQGLTVSESQHQDIVHPRALQYRGNAYVNDLAPSLKIEIVVKDNQLADVLDTMDATMGGDLELHDTITVMSVDDVIRIRTGENGAMAL